MSDVRSHKLISMAEAPASAGRAVVPLAPEDSDDGEMEATYDEVRTVVADLTCGLCVLLCASVWSVGATKVASCQHCCSN